MTHSKASPKIVACYCRVSSAGQKNDSQRTEIRRWLRGNGIKAADVEWFEDKETGRSSRRPAFDRLQAAVFQGTTKTVVVWKLERISRRQLDGISVLADWCERGVRVVSVTQLIDLRGAVGRMVASVLFGIAELKLEYRREQQPLRREILSEPMPARLICETLRSLTGVPRRELGTCGYSGATKA